MILRLVFGYLPPETDPDDVLVARTRLARAARDIHGLDSLIVGARRSPRDERIEAVIATVWRDVESMAKATGVDEQDRFLGARLDLPLTLERADHYEITGRTFAALPPTSTAFLRIISIRAVPNEEPRLMEMLRGQQPRLVELGLVASHIGRRVVVNGVEAVTVGVWPSRETIRRATGGTGERPFFASELAAWSERLTLEMYDGIEIVPRLPVASGPPIYVIDDDLRIVDITASAAAALGWAPEDLVGRSIRELSLTEPASIDANMANFLDVGESFGMARFVVPEAGEVLLHYAARRDVPVIGRHVVLVRRRHEEPPTMDDLMAAVATAFGPAVDTGD